ncbi:hypothetical protein D9619_008628 [Psilocybe cf. subviscida]|uniref:Oxidoreductase AflY n=1 Tax=Psilocybe cf. subviscida TaxID=2480587 RepID=A0A8H5BAQ0_9AGAR|nr:hypothetical protein D9619_008628 [Psilocybe cf. subviscida]
MNADSTLLNNLFPRPTHAHLLAAADTPLVLPHTRAGPTAQSTAALQSILKDNHKKWHIFFNEMGFHNHTAHAAIALWTLGADESILHASYKENAAYQRPAFASPNDITKENWKDHLGDEKYYQAYLSFFTSEIIDKGKTHATMLEEYVFSADANFDGGKNPQMLTRFCDGLLHPLIHAGYGVEFGLPGIFAEGLAQGAVHPGQDAGFIPSSWFTSPAASPVQGLVSRFAGAMGLSSTPGSNLKTDGKAIHSLSVLARVFADDDLKFPSTIAGLEHVTEETPDPIAYTAVSKVLGNRIVKHVDAWLGNIEDELDLAAKVPELLWANVLLYAVGGAIAGETAGEKDGFKADFFLMHLVTSSLFVSSHFATLHGNRPAQIALLKSYFSVSIGWYVSIGRAPLSTTSLQAFFDNTTSASITPPGQLPTPSSDALPGEGHSAAVTPNPWLAITQSAIVHPDDHLPKLVRSLTEYAARWGNTPAGNFADTELPGAEIIDGSLFVRAAGLSMGRVGWVREGQSVGAWDRIRSGGRVTMSGPEDKHGNKIAMPPRMGRS